jgi:hypothetical protein
MVLKFWFGAALAFLVMSPIEVESAPIDTLRDLQRGFDACIKAPADGAGSELTIVFALKRDGSLLGKPRITYSHLVGPTDAQRRFVEAAIAAVAKCFPVSITYELGSAIAGRHLAIRIVGHARTTNT